MTNFLWLVCLNIGLLTALWLSGLDTYVLNWEQKEFIIHTKLCSEINLEQQNSNHLISTHKCTYKATHGTCKGESRSHLSPCAVSSVCQKLVQMTVKNTEYKIFNLQFAHKWICMSSATKERIRPQKSLPFNSRYLLFYAFIFIGIDIIFRIK